MLLTIDIGNSTTTFGIFDDSDLKYKFFIPTIREQTAADIYRLIEPNLKDAISAIVISSVVSETENSYRELAAAFFKIKPFFVDHTFDFGFSIKYHPPASCGADRLADAFAAIEKHGVPLLVCDFGTATTIDAVNSRREYLGGIITPGLNTLAGALFVKTSKLPKVEIVHPEKVIANTTVSSIQSGIFFGYIGLVDGLIERMAAELGEKPKVIATGGLAGLIAGGSKYLNNIEENLMLEGLQLVFQKLTDQKQKPQP